MKMVEETLQDRARNASMAILREQDEKKTSLGAALEAVKKIYVDSYKEKTTVEAIGIMMNECGDVKSKEIWTLMSKRKDIIERYFRISKEQAEEVEGIISVYLKLRKEESVEEIKLPQGEDTVHIHMFDKEKELNLVELLKNCIGMEFYMPHYGVVRLASIDGDENLYFFNGHIEISITKEGLAGGYSNGEVCVFPSKEQRDWSLFIPPWIPEKGDRVWMRNRDGMWLAVYFLEIDKTFNKKQFRCTMQQLGHGATGLYEECVPFDKIPW